MTRITGRLVTVAAVAALGLGAMSGAAVASDHGGNREKERVATSSERVIQGKEKERAIQGKEKERVVSKEKERVVSKEKERVVSKEKERVVSKEKERVVSKEKE